ncbi:anthranilate phosphoribosyltransferase [Bacillus gobiensis]|uniref:anthranilate phosphoribosyltransferase n=1 Tax=Bacillus gobiensis TaxID=1441095 RepID=UPI003D258CFD
MNSLLNHVVNGHRLTEQNAAELMDQMMAGELTPSVTGGILSLLAYRGESVDEITGFVKAIRNRAVQVDEIDEVVDTCGTGGDGASTFNISTAAAIVASSCGAKIAKHGNRSVSSKSGSADVLEHLQIAIQSTPDEAKQAVLKKNMTFLFAPLYHSSMKNVAQVRKELGFRTVFNILGPLINPMQAKRQVIGVYSLEKAKIMAAALERFGPKHVLFVNGEDGLDELTITAPTNVIELKDGERKEYKITPEEAGLSYGRITDIQVNTPEESGKIITSVFNNRTSGTALHIIAFNAGAALYTAGKAQNLKEGVEIALDAIKTGKALDQLEKLKQKKEEFYA